MDKEIEEEKKKHSELDAQIRELERKLRDKQTRSEGKPGAGGGGAGGGSGGAGAGNAGNKGGSGSSKAANQRNARKLEDQLQLVITLKS